MNARNLNSSKRSASTSKDSVHNVTEITIYFVFQQLLGFMYGWLTFYHQGYEVAKEFRPYMTDLQVRLQKVIETLFHPFGVEIKSGFLF